MESPEEPEVPARKRVGRPRKDKKAEPITRTVRVPLQVYEDMTDLLAKQRKRTGQAIDLKDVLTNAWTAYRKSGETANWSLITGRRRLILIGLIAFLAETPEGKPEAQLVDSMLVSIDLVVKFGKKLKRALRLIEEAR